MIIVIAPQKTEVIVKIESNNSINLGRIENLNSRQLNFHTIKKALHKHKTESTTRM